MTAGPSQVHGIGLRRPRNGIGCAGAARLPLHRNKSRRVIPLPISVKQSRIAPERVDRRDRNRRAPQLAWSVTARTELESAIAGAMYRQERFSSAIATR